MPGAASSCDDNNACTDDSCDKEKGCQHANNAASCDDGDACTEKDSCKSGACQPGATVKCDDNNVCTDDSCDKAKGCVTVDNTAACSDDDACTEKDACKDGKCESGAEIKCDDNNVCTEDFCDTDDGCSVAPTAGPCDDGDACTYDDLCGKEVCLPGKATNCDDDNPCTDDACDPKSACQALNNKAACSDGSKCTLDDKCEDGKCVAGSPVKCEDGGQCFKASCTPEDGCLSVPLSFTATCTDGNVCTKDDTCNGQGLCLPGDATSCNDNNACTTDSCDASKGCKHDNNTDACTDGDRCTLGDKCDGGACKSNEKFNCDDANACTDDSCDPVKGCVAINNNEKCDDNNNCTKDEACSGGSCTPQSPTDCDDGNLCTTESCDPGKGCVSKNNTAPCTDGDVCTFNDTCKDGSCASEGKQSCDDNNVCTDDKCDAQKGCVSLPNQLTCTDGNKCTTDDTCADGGCTISTKFSCDDNNVCTIDSCDPKLGCEYKHREIVCTDGDACTVGDKCVDSKCVPGPTAKCNDGNQCTDDSCDQVAGCKNVNHTKACSDGNACTTGDQCAGGVCKPKAAKSCDDGSVCTADSCDLASGCKHKNVNKPCTDGDACTDNDACKAGKCVGVPKVSCDDGNPCTKDTCDAAGTGCVHLPTTLTTVVCTDNNACTVTDLCNGAKCVPGKPRVCEDGDPCSLDSCDKAKGCVKKNVLDGLPCGKTGKCGGGMCQCGAGNWLKVGVGGAVCTSCACNPATTKPDALPALSMGPTMVAPQSALNDVGGYSAAISDQLLVWGTRGDDDKGTDAGSIYVGLRGPNFAVKPHARLFASNPSAGDLFGHAVAAAGRTIVVGAYREDTGSTDSGAVYVLDGDKSFKFSQTALLKASDRASFDYFGFAVAIDRDTIVVGAPQESTTYYRNGAAYVFERDKAGKWAQKAKLLAPDRASSDAFGSSVAVHGDWVIVGAPNADANGTDSGAVYLFKKAGTGAWTFTHKIGGAAAIDNFGWAVSLDAGRAVVGAPGRDSSVSNQGAAYVFGYNGKAGAWAWQATLQGTAKQSGREGAAVAIDGDRILVGAPSSADKAANTGAVYVYSRHSGSWKQQARWTTKSPGANEFFGASIDLIRGGGVIGLYGYSAFRGAIVQVRLNTFSCGKDGKCSCDAGYGGNTCGAITQPCALPKACDDGVACTADSCDPKTAKCKNTPLKTGAACEDGNLCTVSDTCATGVCKAGKPKVCNDGNECTTNACNPALGCQHPARPDGSTCQGGTGTCGDGQCACKPGFVLEKGKCVPCGCNELGATPITTGAEIGPQLADKSPSNANFGGSLAAWGDWLAVGAPSDTVKGTSAGAAHLYQRANGTWIKRGTVHGSTTTSSDTFGQSVALESGTLVVGAPNDEVGTLTNAGAAFVFQRQKDGTWKETALLKHAAPGSFDAFGVSVAIAGKYIAVGATSDDDKGTSSGTVTIFELQANGSAKHVIRLTAPDGTSFDYFGRSLAMMGNRLVVGAYGGNGKSNNTGTAYVFERQLNGSWKLMQELFASDGASYDDFGWSIALHGDTVVVGAHNDDTPFSSSGAAYVFTRNKAGVWQQIGKFTYAKAGSSERVGTSVAIYGDKVLVGAPLDDDNGISSGSVHVLDRDAKGGWTWSGLLVWPKAASAAQFGASVALGADFGAVGAPVGDGRGTVHVLATQVFPCNTAGVCKCKTNFKGDKCDQLDDECSVPGFCDDGNACTKDSCANKKCSNVPLTNGSPCTDGNACTGKDSCQKGACTAGAKLVCNDNQACTADSCDPGLGCVHKPLNNGTTCGTGKCDTGKCSCPVESYPTTTGSCAACSCNAKGTVLDASTPVLGRELRRKTSNTSDYHGKAVALWGDWAVVGAYGHDLATSNHGLVSIYQRTVLGDWAPRGSLEGTKVSSSGYLGDSVAINGAIVAAGAPGDDTKAGNAGSVTILERQGDGSWKATGPIYASNAGSSDDFGQSVAVTGNQVLVGAPDEDTKASNAGMVYVLTRQANGSWKETQKIIAPDGASSDLFGYALAASGNFLVVGAYLDDDGASAAGSAYIFERSNSTWIYRAKIKANDPGSSDYFGRAVAIDSAGRVIVGAPYNDDKGSSSGSVYIFERTGTAAWALKGRFIAPDGASSDYFGWSVGIDGNIALAGAYGDDDNGSSSGSVWALVRDAAGKWTVGKKLAGAGGSAGHFGYSVSVSAGAAVVGAYSNNSYTGAAWSVDFGVLQCNAGGLCPCKKGFSGAKCDQTADPCAIKGFCNDGNPCTIDSCSNKKCVYASAKDGTKCDDGNVCNGADTCQKGKCTAGATLNCNDNNPCTTDSCDKVLGCVNKAVTDGTKCGVGACNSGGCVCPIEAYPAKDGTCANCSCNKVGTVPVATTIAGPVMTQKTAGTYDYLGRSVDRDGDWAVAGAYGDDVKGSDSGSAVVFARDKDGKWTEVAALTASDGASYDNFGLDVSISGGRIVVGAPSEDPGNKTNAGSAYVFELKSGKWAQVAKLVASDAATYDYFGYSVAIDGDWIVVSAYGEDTKASSAGTLYVFQRQANGAWKEVQKLNANDGKSGDYLGHYGAMELNGGKLIAGAYGRDDKGISSGAAYIFELGKNGKFAQTGKLLASDGKSSDYLGRYGVGIDGNRAVVGAYGHDAKGSFSGAAYVFEKQKNGSWAQTAKLLASDAQSSDYFGYSVAVADDVVLVGAYGEDSKSSSGGAVYAFRNEGGKWAQVAKLHSNSSLSSQYYGRTLGGNAKGWFVGADGYSSSRGAVGSIDAAVSYPCSKEGKCKCKPGIGGDKCDKLPVN